MKNVSNNIYILLRLVLFIFCYLLLLRISFFIYFSPQADDMAGFNIAKAFYLGFKFDLRLTLLTLLPVFLGILTLRKKVMSGIWIFYLVGILMLITICYFVDFATYAYIQTRLNATLIKFLEAPTIAGDMIWQTYPIIPLSILLFSILMIYYLFLKKFIFSSFKNPKILERKYSIPIWIVFLILNR